MDSHSSDGKYHTTLTPLADFDMLNEWLSMHQYIKVMLNHLPETRDREGLVVNNDQSPEWDEFTGHIIELGIVRKDRTFIDAIKNYYQSTSWTRRSTTLRSRT